MTNEKHKPASNNEANDNNREKISERKLAANRANAGKSTGPRTERGKSHSRLNSWKHGLLARTVLFDCNGNCVEPELLELHEALREQYGDDTGTRLRIDVAVMEYWRMKQAIALESRQKNVTPYFLAEPWIPGVQRYATAGRNSFMKIIDSLAEAKQTRNEGAEAEGDVPQPDLAVDEGQSDEPQRAEAKPARRGRPQESKPSIEETGGAPTILPPPYRGDEVPGELKPSIRETGGSPTGPVQMN